MGYGGIVRHFLFTDKDLLQIVSKSCRIFLNAFLLINATADSALRQNVVACGYL
jgi:hypothetical protein